MNKKLERAMTVAANLHVSKYNLLFIPDFGDVYTGYKEGFQKCHELMAEREARLAKELRNCISVIDETSDLSQNTVDTLVKQSNDVLKDLGVEK